MLRKATNTHGEDWDLEIPFVLFNYMNQDHEATGYSPFFLSHGYIPRTPRLDVAPPLAKSQQSASQWAATLSSSLKHQQNFRKRVLRHRDQLRIVSTRPEQLRPKTPSTPEREEPHTTS